MAWVGARSQCVESTACTQGLRTRRPQLTAVQVGTHVSVPGRAPLQHCVPTGWSEAEGFPLGIGRAREKVVEDVEGALA